MSVTLNRICRSIPASYRTRFVVQFNSSVFRRESNNSSKLNESVQVIEEDVDTVERELEIEKLRDKSRLKPEHRNMLFGKRPYSEPVSEHHTTVRYNRKIYGKYGSESGVNPGIMWPTKDDINNVKEYEKVAYPLPLQEMIVAAEKELEAKEERIQKMQASVIEKLKKLQTWKDELRNKLAKKETDALDAREKKAQMVEEVRRHFGFTVDPRDERFQQMLADKQKEQAKRDKQARIEEKERKALERLMAKHEAASEEKRNP